MGAKENILQKIRNAKQKVEGANQDIDLNSEIYTSFDGDLVSEFIFNIENVDGTAIACESIAFLKDELIKVLNHQKIDSVYCVDSKIQKLLEGFNIPFTSGSEDFLDMETAITGCEFILARTGSILITSQAGSGRRLNVFPPNHIVIVNENQLVKDLDVAFNKLEDKYEDNIPSLITNITGPSRTADIEKTLIIGAHGPKKLIVFILKG